MLTHPSTVLWSEVVRIASLLHWPLDSILDLEHPVRRRCWSGRGRTRSDPRTGAVVRGGLDAVAVLTPRGTAALRRRGVALAATVGPRVSSPLPPLVAAPLLATPVVAGTDELVRASQPGPLLQPSAPPDPTTGRANAPTAADNDAGTRRARTSNAPWDPTRERPATEEATRGLPHADDAGRRGPTSPSRPRRQRQRDRSPARVRT